MCHPEQILVMPELELVEMEVDCCTSSRFPRAMNPDFDLPLSG